MSLTNRKTPRQIRPKDLVGDVTSDGEDLSALLHNRSASQAPASGDNFAAGYAVGSTWIYGQREYLCVGDGQWVEQRTTAAEVPISDVTGLTTALDSKQDELTGVGDVPGLSTALDGKQSLSEKGQPNGYASLDGSGKVPESQLPDVGGGADWGDIGGTLSDQTDLQSALDGKAASSHTHSASDITSGTLPINRGGTGGTTAEGARDSLGVPSRPVQDAPPSSGNYRKILFTSAADPSTAQADISYDTGTGGESLSVTSLGLFTGYRHLYTAGRDVRTEGGAITTSGGDISPGSGNVRGSSGCSIGWTSSSNSPTGSGTNCHINSSGVIVRQTSQGKLKSDQAPLETSIDEIMAWQPKSFRWVEEMGGHEDIGLIAEEVAALDPRAAWCDHDQVLKSSEEPADPEDPDSETVEVQRYACCPEQPVVPLGVHYERAWVHLLAATQDFYRRYQEERTELLARIEALEGGVQ